MQQSNVCLDDLRHHQLRICSALPRGASGPAREAPLPPKKTIRVCLWLRVERNSKYVWESELTISYEDDEDLNRTINDILIERIRPWLFSQFSRHSAGSHCGIIFCTAPHTPAAPLQ